MPLWVSFLTYVYNCNRYRMSLFLSSRSN
jgi:hypothetical protein